MKDIIEKIEIIKNTMEKMKEQDKDIFNLYYNKNKSRCYSKCCK